MYAWGFRYMMNYTQSEWGNDLDSVSFVIPNLLPAMNGNATMPAYKMTTVPNLIYVGVLGFRKGFDTFVELVCMCNKYRNVAAHVFAGLNAAMQENATASCNAQFVFHGTKKSSEMWGMIRELQGLLLFTSRHENLPMVPLEAAVNNVPVIASPSGGLAEVLANAKEIIMLTPTQMWTKLKDLFEDDPTASQSHKSIPRPFFSKWRKIWI